MKPYDIPPLMDSIVTHLRRLGRKAPDLLQPPLSVHEFQTWVSRFPFSLTHELNAIYSWRNGTRADQGELLENLYLFPGFYLLSIEDAYRTYQERRDTPQWREEWFPLFADEAGDFYVVPCDKVPIDRAVVIGFLHGEPEQVPEYESLAAMAATLDAAFDEAAFYLDRDDTMEIDDDKYRRIARAFNPEIKEWQN
jgi:hypothetical protein